MVLIGIASHQENTSRTASSKVLTGNYMTNTST
jgi:hypothetical protein